jgi:hypothetical protein
VAEPSCGKCKYDLSGLKAAHAASLVCPECGCAGPHAAPNINHDLATKRADRTGIAAAIVLLLLVTGLVIRDAPRHERPFVMLIVGPFACLAAPFLGLIFGSAAEVIRLLLVQDPEVENFQIRSVIGSSFIAFFWILLGSIALLVVFFAIS